MLLTRLNRRLIAIGIAAGLVVLTAFFASSSAVADIAQLIVLAPGLLVASRFWPQGVHTGMGMSTAGTWLFFALTYSISFCFWAVITDLLLSWPERWRPVGRD